MAENSNWTKVDIDRIFDQGAVAIESGKEIFNTVYDNITNYQQNVDSRRNMNPTGGTGYYQPQLNYGYGYEETNYPNPGNFMYRGYETQSGYSMGYPGFTNPHYGEG